MRRYVARKKGTLSIPERLGLSDSWKLVDFGKARFVDIVEAGITMDYTVKTSDRLGDVLSVSIVLVEKNDLQCGKSVHFCQADAKLNGYSPASVSLFRGFNDNSAALRRVSSVQ